MSKAGPSKTISSPSPRSPLSNSAVAPPTSVSNLDPNNISSGPRTPTELLTPAHLAPRKTGLLQGATEAERIEFTVKDAVKEQKLGLLEEGFFVKIINNEAIKKEYKPDATFLVKLAKNRLTLFYDEAREGHYQAALYKKLTVAWITSVVSKEPQTPPTSPAVGPKKPKAGNETLKKSSINALPNTELSNAPLQPTIFIQYTDPDKKESGSMELLPLIPDLHPHIIDAFRVLRGGEVETPQVLSEIKLLMQVETALAAMEKNPDGPPPPLPPFPRNYDFVVDDHIKDEGH